MKIEADALRNFRHGFFTRRGGISSGAYDSLNCRIGRVDDPAAVMENRRRVMRALDLPAERLTSLFQVHGAGVIPLTCPLDSTRIPEADALVTATPGVALGVLGADCAPILLADPINRVIGAAHSGWQGTLLDVGSATVRAMEKLGADRRNIVAVIGPAIAADSYEVSPDFPAAFTDKTPALAIFFAPSTTKAGHFLFDLKGCIAWQLQASGVKQVDILPYDTYSNADMFFSNRRATHQRETGFGLQISVISIPE